MCAVVTSPIDAVTNPNLVFSYTYHITVLINTTHLKIQQHAQRTYCSVCVSKHVLTARGSRTVSLCAVGGAHDVIGDRENQDSRRHRNVTILHRVASQKDLHFIFPIALSRNKDACITPITETKTSSI
jgi:hypothetical protein